MLFFKYDYTIEINKPQDSVIRLLEETVDPKKMYAWQNRNPFYGVIMNNRFLLKAYSFFSRYEPEIHGFLSSFSDKTKLEIKIKQTPLFYVIVCLSILMISGFFLAIEGVKPDTVAGSVVLGLMYYITCLAGFYMQVKGIKKKFSNVFNSSPENSIGADM